MRIELNYGGLWRNSDILLTHSHLESLINKSSNLILALESIKKFTYNANGGVGNLQGALTQVQNKINGEQLNKSNLQTSLTRYTAFVDTTKRIDDAVSTIVMRNNKEFYRVNTWAAPNIGININSLFFVKDWLINAMHWLGGKDSTLKIIGAGGATLGAIGLLSNKSKNDNGLFSIDPYATGSGPSGKVDDHSVSGSLLSGKAGINAKIAGIDAGVKAEGDLVGGSAKYEMGGQWDVEKGEIGVGITGKAEGHLAKGSVSANLGIMSEKIEGSVGNVSAKGEAGLTLMSDGKFAPAAKVEASAGASVAKGSVTQTIGTENLDVHSKADGEFLVAKAKAGASAGVITYTDEQTGAVKTKIGAEASAGAEAYVAQGTAKGGVNICGLKIDVGVSGKAGGAGVKVGGGVSTAGVSGEVGAGLGLGVGLKVDVDWSDFKPKKLLPWNWFK